MDHEQTTSSNKRPEPDHIDLCGPWFEVTLIEFAKEEEHADLFYEIANGDLRMSSCLRLMTACQKKFREIHKFQSGDML